VTSDAADLLPGARQGRMRDVGRLVSIVEDDAPEAADLLRRCAESPGHARVIGVTGPPGAGKSTSTARLVEALRARGERVAVLAVDPSSPFSGGALLGDRVRMAQVTTDSDVFIRSMAARGHLGGLALATSRVIRLLGSLGYDWILLETVGVGQSEIDVALASDTTIVLVAPGMGDGVQAAKAGILEVADVLVVNKADRPGAQEVVRDLRAVAALGSRRDAGWQPPIVSTVATEGVGVDEVLAVLEEHARWLADSGEGDRRAERRVRQEVETAVLSLVRTRLESGSALDAVVEEVRSGRMDVQRAAEVLLDRT
jgi:LAO/AO transport system kinase